MADQPQQRTINTGTQIGDYAVGEPIARGSQTCLWEATQLSVQRLVILCSADATITSDPLLKQEFLADVRTKASVDHPLISSILEAVETTDHCFYAMEKLHGNTLGELHDQGESISPVHIVRILQNLASAYLYLEENNIAWLQITPHDIHIDSKYHCRITNMAVSGPPDPEISTRDKNLIGQLLHDILEPDQPGSTRTASLLDYMADLERQVPLTWQQIHDLANQVEHQLTETQSPEPIQSSTMRMHRPGISGAALAKILSAIAVVALVAAITWHLSNRETPPEQRRLTGMVHIPAGTYPGPDGLPVKLVRDYWIDVHEVTIGDYAQFLEAIDLLQEDKKTVFQHENQPREKTSHHPDDWDKLYAAAQSGGTWNQQKIDLNYPVVGIDWWDAYAYAEWKDRRLPSREEWYAAASSSDNPENLQPASGWNAVDYTSKTQNGIHGLADNVSEWTRERSLNRADPTQPKRYVICGASYLKPKFGVRAREWVDDRSLRRPDIGFRTISYSPPQPE